MLYPLSYEGEGRGPRAGGRGPGAHLGVTILADCLRCDGHNV